MFFQIFSNLRYVLVCSKLETDRYHLLKPIPLLFFHWYLASWFQNVVTDIFTDTLIKYFC